MSDLVLPLPRLDEEDEFLRAHRATSPDAPKRRYSITGASGA
ncbi:MAG: hypothetical protein WCQ64_10785 [Acidobacteriota bacterium]